ncbi:MAG: isopenicillin N synthase family oxygenase [Gammaproteobacteria bacterium]|nr:isopenicillin N synthase family oxygenase [Gammaproteobacteria bacterium]
MKVVDYLSPTAASDFVESLRTTGFGVLSNHPIQKSWLESIYQNWLAFFNSDEKEDYLFDEQAQDGYYPTSISETAKGNTIKDLKEFYHVYPSGRVPEHLEQEIRQYYAETSKFASELLSWIEHYSPEEVKRNYTQPLPEMIRDSEQTLLRVLHYPPLSGDEKPGSVRAAAHEDINFLTVLPAASEPGLQVKLNDGQWMDVPCNFGNLIINIGDMLQEVTKGYFPSTSHRVINPKVKTENRSRISLPLFLHPRPDVVLSERYTAHSYLEERLRELGIKS